MFKRFGALALMLTASALFIYPSRGQAQDRYDGRGYYSYRDRHDYNHFGNDRSRSFREEERRERKWREKELRRQERWERENFRNRYRDYKYRYDGYGRPYRPY